MNIRRKIRLMICILTMLVGLPILAAFDSHSCSSIYAGQQYAVQHYSVEDGLSQNTVMSILQDKQGFMWFGTWDGLNRFDGYTFTTYKVTQEDDPSIYLNNRIEYLYEDSLENLWWMTYDERFYYLDRERQQIHSAERQDVPSLFFSQPDAQAESLRMDKNGIIWQATDEPGISRYRDGQWKHLQPTIDPRYAGQLRKHFILLEDAHARTWVNPTGGGFGYYDSERDEIVFPLHGVTNMIHTAYFDHSGLLWLSTYDRGVDCINLEPQPYCIHRTSESQHSGEVRAMVTDDKGTLLTFTKDKQIYCACNSPYGLLLGAKGAGICNLSGKNPLPRVHLSNNDIYDIEVGRDGCLYIATYGGGINIVRHPQDQLPLTQVVGNGLRVRDIIVADSTLWAATTSGLLHVDLDDEDDPEYDLLSSCDIRSLYIHNNRLWVGTFGSGLCYVDIDSVPYALHSTTENSSIVLSMIGSNDTIWFTSEKGITQYNLTTGTYTYLDALEHTADYFTEAEAIRTADGKIHFGFSDGYVSLNPSEMTHSQSVPTLRIKRTREDEGTLDVEYAALEFAGPAKIHYAYRLDGLDHDWHYAQTQRKVNYTHLSPGKYTFRVRSTNRDGEWVNNEVTYSFVVPYPFWRSWWAIVIYVLISIGIVLLILYVMRSQASLREEMQVEQKVTDIKLRFFTNISHELRTPLTLITGPIDNILASEHLSASVRQQLEIVQSNSRRMMRLVNQLLDFRKIQNKKMRLKVQRTLLSSIIEEVTANFNKEAYDKHIHLMIESNVEDSTIWVDRERMDTILYNLLSNAFKFTPAGKTIAVKLSEKPGYLIMSVSDEGIGIPKERRNLLFERFVSHDELVASPDKPGTGIGLNLVKELVDLHHGLIEVESEVGKGTTFHILLRRGTEHFNGEVEVILKDDTEAARTEIKALDQKIQQVAEKKEMHSVLVVDDSEDMRRFLTAILSSDYHIRSAADGKQALALVNEEQPDLIISDLMMPNMDGLELVKILKQSIATNHIPVILLTAKAAIEDRLQGLEEGADDYVTKPFEPDYIRVRIRNIIQQREQLEAAYRERLLRLEPKKVEEQEPNDKFLAKLLEFMEQQMDNSELTVDQMVDYVGMGRTVFFNRLKKVTGMSPVEFIREMRIKRAAQLLETGTYNVSEVTYMVGLNDSRYFSKCFKNTYGMTPSEYKRLHEK